MLDFVWKTKSSFKKVRKEFEGLKASTNEWIVFLDGKGHEFEKRISKMEDRLDRIEETMFNVLSR